MIIISMGGFHFGYNALITNILSVPLTKEVYSLSEKDQDIATGDFGFYFAMGTLISSLFLGYLTKFLGRVRLLIFLEIFCIPVYGCLLIKNLTLLKILRFFLGVIAGVNFSLAPSLCKELLPKTIGTLGGNALWLFDVVFEFWASLQPFIFGGNQGLYNNWRIIISFGLIITLIRLLGFYCYLKGVESPAYYLEKHKDIEKRREKITKCSNCYYVEESALRKTEITLKNHMKMKKRRKKLKKKLGLSSLCQKHYRARFTFVALLNIFSQLTGLSFMMFFSYKLFEEINGTGSLMVLAQTAGMSIGGIFGMFVIKFKRKPLFLITYSLSGFFILLLTYGIYKEIIPMIIICMLLYITSVSSSGSVLSVYMPEVLSPFPIGVAVAGRHLMAAMAGKTSPFFLDEFGVEKVLIFFGVCCFLIVVFVGVFCIETKGKKMHDIADEFEGVKK